MASYHSGTSRRVSQQHSDIRVGLPTTLGHLGRPPDRYRASGKASLLLPDIREGQRPLPVIWVSLPTTQGHPGESPDHSRASGKASRPLPVIREGLILLLDIWVGLQTTPDIREGLPTTPKYS